MPELMIRFHNKHAPIEKNMIYIVPNKTFKLC